MPVSTFAIGAQSDQLACGISINRYLQIFNCPELSTRIADTTGIEVERLVWGIGSEELLRICIDIITRNGGVTVASRPTFAGYPAMFHAADAQVTNIPMRADGGVDIAAMLAAVTNDTGLLICLAPNNPSGVMPTEAELQQLIEHTPDHVLLLIDGAYHEFAHHAGCVDPLPLLHSRSGPWLTTRTFSKAYALAGMRIGYGLCSSTEIANTLRCCMGPLHVPTLSQIAARAAYDDTDYTQFILNSCAEQRARLLQGLTELGLQPLASVCNFVSVATPCLASELVRDLLAQGVLINAWD